MPPAVIARPAPAPAPGWPGGHRIGSFELMAAMPSDGVGTVYRAWDHALARPVAIEEYFPPSLARRDGEHAVIAIEPSAAEAFERGREMFVDAWRALARCDHPSLVRLLHLIEAHGTAYCVMPWYSGRSLHAMRQQIGAPLDETSLRALLDDLLGALQAYYSVAWVHGGIDASKVLYLDDGRALLLAPGAAGRFEAGDGLAGPWIDFFALAALARFCITGLPLPEAAGGTHEPLAAAIARQFAEGPAPHYSAALLDTLDAALAPDIAKRPQTVAQFREWLAQGPPQAAPDVEPTVAAPAAAVWQFPSPSRQAAAPPPTEPAVPETFGAANAASDAATVQFIRRVLDAIPEPAVPVRKAHRPPAPAPVASIVVPDIRATRAPPRQPPRRRSAWPVWAAVGAVVCAALAINAWQPSPTPEREVAAVRPVQPDPSPVATPEPAQVAVAPPTVAALPPPQPVAPPEPVSVPIAAAPVEAPVVTPEPPPEPAPVAAPRAPAPTTDRSASTLPTASPRAQCGARTAFSLYRCMQQQCALARWQAHPQCARLRATDTVE